MLDDQTVVLETADLDSGYIKPVLEAARTWNNRLGSEAEQPDAIAVLVNRVELRTDGVDVSIKLPIPGPTKSQSQFSEIAIKRSFPMQLKRRGPRLRVNRASCAYFIASPRSRETCQTCQTGWRMSQSYANRSLQN